MSSRPTENLTFKEKLLRYAEVAVKIGVNVQPGQRLHIIADIENAALARACAKAAYEVGASFVDVRFNDPYSGLIRFENAPDASFDYVPPWLPNTLADDIEAGTALLNLSASDPDLLNHIDPDKRRRAQMAAVKLGTRVSQLISAGLSNWAIVAVPIQAWADKIFPKLPESERVGQLWETIFNICRINSPDPVAAWQAHNDALYAKANILNDMRLSALHFTGPGTDLHVALADAHQWLAAYMESQSGIRSVVNLPTEEVFTAPHAAKVEGTVTATKPLAYTGSVIEDFHLRFEGGVVVEAKAAKNQAILENILNTDDNARRLGEVALVPHGSPISQSGLLFYSTLYDENAASHIALGNTYRFSIEGALEMDDEAYAQAGGNSSMTHVDFMIGSGEIDVDGITTEGANVPVMRKGEWTI